MESTRRTKVQHLPTEKRTGVKKRLSRALARARTLSFGSYPLPSTIIGHLQSQRSNPYVQLTPEKRTTELLTPQKNTRGLLSSKKNPLRLTIQRKKNPGKLTSQKKKLGTLTPQKKNPGCLTPQKQIKKRKTILDRFTPKKKLNKKKILGSNTQQTNHAQNKTETLTTLAEVEDCPDGRTMTLVRKQAFSSLPSLKRAGEVETKRNSYSNVRFFWEENSSSSKKSTTSARPDQAMTKTAFIENLLFPKPKSIVQHLWNLQMEQLGDFVKLPPGENIKWKHKEAVITFDNLKPLTLSFASSMIENYMHQRAICFEPVQTSSVQPTDQIKNFEELCSLDLDASVAEEPDLFETSCTFPNSQNLQRYPSLSDMTFISKSMDVSLPTFWGLLVLSFVLDGLWVNKHVIAMGQQES